MMPSAKHGDPQLGIDIHLCVVPPSPSPVPLPTPHMSVVFDPFDYVPIIGATVSVFGMKRATAGTGAIVVHIPPGFPFAPMLPDKDDELFMGSATVLADGDPLSYLALPVLGCQVAGMPSPPRPKKKRISPPRLLPTTFNLAIPTTVRVGGPPTISMMGMAAKGAFAGLGKLAKSKFAKNLGDRFKKFRQKLFKNMDPGFLKCKVLRAEPVNILTGEVVVEQVDFTLQGRISLAWVRSYSSNSRRQGACGYGWESPADARLEVDREDGSVMFCHPSEGAALFPNLPAAQGDGAAVLELMDGALLSEHGDEFRVRTKGDLIYHFPKALMAAIDEGRLEYPIGRISDLCGNWLQYERLEGELSAIRESAGRQLGIEHQNGRIYRLWLSVPETGFRHPFVEYEYDAAGDLTGVRDALGNPYCFAYDAHHMVRHTDRTGLSFHYAYDSSGESRQVVHAWGDGGLHDYRFSYWPAVRETRISDALGHVWVVHCDERSLPILEIDPLGGRTIFEYDDAGRTVAVVDAGNHRTAYSFDERGNLVTLIRPDGSSIEIEFDADNKPTCIRDPNGGLWRQRWDARGLLLEQASPLGAVTRYEYAESGLPVAQIDPLQGMTGFDYDVNGYLAAIRDPLLNVTRVRRDDLGNVLERTDPLGHARTYAYDEKSRLIEVGLPDGTRIHCNYDAQDRLVRYVDENGAETRFDYLGQGAVKRRTQPDGHSIEYHYDGEERLVGVTNQRGETYQLRRDALGRVVEEIDYWGQSTSYEFDVSGHLRRSCNALGQIVLFDADACGRIRRKTFEHPLVAGKLYEESFDFDLNGRLIRCANPDIEVVRCFDLEGRLVEERQGSFVVRNTYDEVGNRVKRETSAGNRVLYDHDALGRLLMVQVNDEPALTIERDAAGQALKETLGSGLDRHYRYDEQGRVLAQGLKRGEEWLFATQFEYNRAGELTERRDTKYGLDRYSYDLQGQIHEHVNPQGELRRFFNDPAGDRWRSDVLETAAGGVAPHEHMACEWERVCHYEEDCYRFDRAGRLVFCHSAGSSTDASHAAEKDVSLLWDANQRLVRSETDGTETIYLYDPLGRRVLKRTGDSSTVFFWDGDALLGEQSLAAPRDELWPKAVEPVLPGLQGEHRPGSGVREYVYDPGTFIPLILIDKEARAGPFFYYQNEPNGSPTRLIDRSGQVVWAAEYDVWGRLGTLHIGTVFNPIRMQGQYEDVETGFYYNRYRYYAPHVGCFLAPDPIGLLGGTNVYQYAPNTKTWSDPLGLASVVGFKRWRRGEPIDKPLPDGSAPDWDTVRSRYWKNRYELARHTGEFSPQQLAELRKGNAPMDYNRRTGQWERRELHHVHAQQYAGPNNPLNLRELTPDQHAEVDPFRHRAGVQTCRGIL
ncbi:DUF6531 domain-containing protein [Aquabacterium sp. A7-Y]|uniref:RHS repeat-associated core domain-containing protein n=1 Tax=Aquabacterium sp. A7-Y TaxID=1349605 RepID=UPI00223DEEDA|nr:RHS repeat-associated core domain-containing protein [Aquabacterium sp. A7-Y]MCW7537018.1 DUF6531 domain-containing protein [Aquabacterium sp. A7-Y]